MSAVQEATPAAVAKTGKLKTIQAVAADAASASTEAPAAQAPARVVKPLARNAGSLAQYKRNTWLFNADDDHQPEDFEDPAMWVAAAHEFGLHDRVEVIHPKWALDLIAYDVGLGATRLQRVTLTPLPPRDPGSEKRCPDGYEIRPGKPGQPTWIVVRTSDGFVMNNDFQNHRTREIALQWLLSLAIFRVDQPRYY